MKHWGSFGVGVVSVVSATALLLSIYPGVLNDLVGMGFLLAIVLFPVVAIGGAIALAWLWGTGRLSQLAVPRAHAVVTATIFVVTYGLLKSYVPRRLAFAASRSAFEEYLDRPALADTLVSLDKRLGVYVVEDYATDARGGTYFRVYSGADGIGPDVMSYGFCFRPNAMGTPYGAAHYRTLRLGDGWCWFRASDDWY